MRNEVSSSKLGIEKAALRALCGYLKAQRSQSWLWDESPRPDDLEPNSPSYDFDLTNSETGATAALEITQFSWPVDGTTIKYRLDALAHHAERELASELSGAYTIGASINHARDAKLLVPKNWKAAQRSVPAWFRGAGRDLRPGESAFVDGFPGLRVTRQATEGALSITIPTSVTSIGYPNWLNDADRVIASNAPKFEGVGGSLRWLLLIDPGMVGRLEITGPVLDVPPVIDELFFIDYWPPSPKDVFSYFDVRHRSDGMTFHRESGAVTASIPFRTR